MKREPKRWIDKNGECYGDAKLGHISKSWDLATWNYYLTSTVEEPLRETLVKSSFIEHCPDDTNDKIYPIISDVERFPDVSANLPKFIKKLSPRERAVIEDIFWNGYTLELIAKRLNISSRAVRTERDRALKKLRKLYCLNYLKNQKKIHGYVSFSTQNLAKIS